MNQRSGPVQAHQKRQTMFHQLSSNTILSLDAESRRIELEALVRQTKGANGSASAYLKAKIAAFEEQFGISSQELSDKLTTGEVEETEDIASWLFYIDALRAHAG